MADQASAHPTAAKIRTATDVKHSSERAAYRENSSVSNTSLGGFPRNLLRAGRVVCRGQFSRYGVAEESGWILGEDLHVRPG